MSNLHPDVEQFQKTCAACPEQYSGTLWNGKHFYYRYRFGRASLAVGDTPEEVEGHAHASLRHGEPLQGNFDTEEDRDDVFALLLAEIRAR